VGREGGGWHRPGDAVLDPGGRLSRGPAAPSALGGTPGLGHGARGPCRPSAVAGGGSAAEAGPWGAPARRMGTFQRGGGVQAERRRSFLFLGASAGFVLFAASWAPGAGKEEQPKVGASLSASKTLDLAVATWFETWQSGLRKIVGSRTLRSARPQCVHSVCPSVSSETGRDAS